MADVKDLAVVKATLRCPMCASTKIRRNAKIEKGHVFKFTEWCGSCSWRRKPTWVRV